MKIKWDEHMMHNRAMLAAVMLPDKTIMRIVRTLSCMDARIRNMDVNAHHGILLVVTDWRDSGTYDLVFTRTGMPLPRIMWKVR